MLTVVLHVILLSTFNAVDPPTGCRFLNPIRDPTAERALVDYFDKSEPFIFSETNFYQPQCLLCESIGGQVCFGYRGGASYGVKSGTMKTVRLVSNLPYLYTLGANVGALYTTVTAIVALREDMVIPYRTLTRFKARSMRKVTALLESCHCRE